MNSVFGIDSMQRALNFHMVRQNMISANVANVDTPGYAPREVTRPEESGMSGAVGMVSTNDSHIPLGADGRYDGFEVNEERVEVPGNDLNFVSLDHEMARLAANSIRFETVGKLVKEHLGIVSYAASNANKN